MNIKPGPLMWEYAAVFGIVDEFGNPDVDEIACWVSRYVNGPWDEVLHPYLEPTERERLESIRTYIEGELNERSIALRIRRERREATTPLPQHQKRSHGPKNGQQSLSMKEAA